MMSDKKIISIVRGGIGNQMFIYAASRRMAIRNNATLTLITDLFENETHGRHFLLDKFHISANTIGFANAGVPYNKYIHELARRLNRQLYPFAKHYPHYLIERTKNYLGRRVPVDTRALNPVLDDYLIVDGFFQNESYFSDVADILKKDFTLRESPRPDTRGIAREIANSNAVCIHFRRTELEHRQMLVKHGDQRWLKGYTEGLDVDYYRKAIDVIENRVPSPRYYCFSDHPDWVSKNIKLPVPFKCISQHNTQGTCHSDIYLMSQCKHHIISHSTFAWWGAWLSKNPEQLVIAPVNICGKPKSPDYPDKWTTIEVCQKKVS